MYSTPKYWAKSVSKITREAVVKLKGSSNKVRLISIRSNRKKMRPKSINIIVEYCSCETKTAIKVQSTDVSIEDEKMNEPRGPHHFLKKYKPKQLNTRSKSIA